MTPYIKISGELPYRRMQVWQRARELSIITFQLAASLPAYQRFELGSHMRRGGLTISSNIAEGYGRYTEKDRRYFYGVARGSLYEIDSAVDIAQELQFFERPPRFVAVADEINRLLTKMMLG